MRVAYQAAIVAGLVAATGCSNMAEQVSRSPLKPPRMSPDSVVLELLFVRFPPGEAVDVATLWDELDEMHLSAEQRERLVRNGFRVGLVGGQIPVGLSRLLELKDKPPPGAGSLQTSVTDWEQEPRVVRRHMQMRPGARTEIVASDIADEMSVLLSDGPALEGEIFQAAQAVLAAKAFPQSDGQVRVQLVPEVHYGESKMRYVNTLGAIRIEPGRSRRTFDRLAIDAVLAPGHMLVLGTVSDRPGSLGYRFFTQTTSGQLEHKLLIIRLAQTQHDELFGPADPAPLDLTL